MNDIFFKNTLIIGGSGMVGSNINFGIKPTSSELNICDINSINNYISKISDISCIINLAAINLRESEENINKSIDVNINGTINILNIAKKLNIPLVLLSSGAVFSDQNNNVKFNEQFETCPNSIYGCTKESSEKIAMLYEKTILIRTGWLFGGNQKNHYKFVELCINNLYINSNVYGSNNFIGSPTYVIDLIEHMKFLIINNKFGIHHVVNSDFASEYDIALEICNYLDKDIDLVNSVNSTLVPNSTKDRSNTEILESIYNFNNLRNWKDALKNYIKIYLEKKNINLLKIKEKNVDNKFWYNRDKCRLCNSYKLNCFYNLKPTPLANNFVKKPIYQDIINLDLCICEDCNHIQLLQIIDPNYQYLNYKYISSISKNMVHHLENSVIEFINILNINKNDNILEIGANEGVCIKYLLKNGYNNIIGIDPAKNINKMHNLPIIPKFFGSNILDELKEKYNSFKLIYAFHCCAHIENIKDIFETIYNLLDFNGTFIMEVGYFYEVFKNNLFDVIYHEHIDYHTCSVIKKFAENNNLLLYNVKENNIQGGSIQFYFCKKDYNKEINNIVLDTIEKENNIELFNYNKLLHWKNNIYKNAKDINYIINSLKKYGNTIVGYGAAAKLTTFMYEYNLTNDCIKYIIDDSILKQNLYTPGLNIEIKSIDILNKEKIDYIIIFAWNFSEEIIKKLYKYRENGLRIIIPCPEIRII
jgi:dTDP-4-dehydrorhamnose reductase/predicted rRNA methylase YqxC with S4 and FtsJ domains